MKQPVTINIPNQLEKLFELLGVTTQEVLQGFVNDLALEVHHTHGSDERHMAVEYFMRVGYGMYGEQGYTFEDVEEMFDDLEWLRTQWPGNDPLKEKRYQQQRRIFLKDWIWKWKDRSIKEEKSPQ